MSVNVRPAGPDDLDVIVEFNCRLAEETEGKSLDMALIKPGVGSVLGDPALGFYIVAEDPDSGDVIGQVSITFEWSDWRNGMIWWLQSVYVREAWRGKGVLRELFDSLKAEAAKDGRVIGFRLYAEVDNQGAHSAYERLGFERVNYEFFECLECGGE